MALTPLSSASYWNHFVRYSAEQGIVISDSVVKLAPAINQDFIPFDDLKGLIVDINAKYEKPWFGLEIAQSLQLSSHGSLGFAVSHGLNLKECLALIIRYYQTRLQAMSLEASQGTDYYRLYLTENCDWSPVGIVLYEVISLSLLKIIEYVIGTEIAHCTFNFPYPAPDWLEKYDQFMPCKFCFGKHEASIEIPQSLLSIPCVSFNSRSVDFAKTQCDIELGRLQQYDTLTDKLTYLIEKNKQYQMTAESAAQLLNISKSTLTRKLRLENSSFKSVLENLKKQQAVYLLENTDLTVEVISLELGYEDLSNFGRSFKRWFACAPRAYRQKYAK